MQSAFAHCEGLIRNADKDRFLASLFAAADRRPFLHALYAFDIEVMHIAARVREPMAGELRLQWWREVLEGGRAEEAQANPAAAALMATVTAARLPTEPLLVLLDARAFDLYAEPMQSMAHLEGYAAKTAGTVIRLAARILNPLDTPALDAAATHAALASTATRTIQEFAGCASRGRLYVPVDVLERHGASAADIFAGRATPQLLSALGEMRAYARRHFDAMRAALAGTPASVRPAFLPIALTPLVLEGAERAGYDPFASPLDVPQWRRQWRLWRASRWR
jgi:phytoene synthase